MITGRGLGTSDGFFHLSCHARREAIKEVNAAVIDEEPPSLNSIIRSLPYAELTGDPAVLKKVQPIFDEWRARMLAGDPEVLAMAQDVIDRDHRDLGEAGA